jgi:putative PIN family toxin of toxin-antitoxin system
MKIVVDTNTLINAAEDENNYGNRIINEVLDGKIEAYANPQTLNENILMVSKKISDQEYLDKLATYFDTVKQVEGKRIHVVEDEQDNKILASALAAGVDYLVTSDWHLLKIAEYGGVKIVSPQGFWAEYESETGKGWRDWLDNFVN